MTVDVKVNQIVKVNSISNFNIYKVVSVYAKSILLINRCNKHILLSREIFEKKFVAIVGQLPQIGQCIVFHFANEYYYTENEITEGTQYEVLSVEGNNFRIRLNNGQKRSLNIFNYFNVISVVNSNEVANYLDEDGIRAVIDIALMIGDKEWFNELSDKLKGTQIT